MVKGVPRLELLPYGTSQPSVRTAHWLVDGHEVYDFPFKASLSQAGLGEDSKELLVVPLQYCMLTLAA